MNMSKCACGGGGLGHVLVREEQMLETNLVRPRNLLGVCAYVPGVLVCRQAPAARCALQCIYPSELRPEQCERALLPLMHFESGS